jgi:hypothetical protein
VTDHPTIIVHPSTLLDVLLERVERTPGDIAAWLVANEQRETPRRAVIASDGMRIAIIKTIPGTYSWQLDAMHCTHQAHGTHRRYDKLYSRLRSLADLEAPRCTECDGSGWIPADTDRGRTLLMLAQNFRVYRGVRMADNGYEVESLDASTLRDQVTMFVAAQAKKEVADEEEG